MSDDPQLPTSCAAERRAGLWRFVLRRAAERREACGIHCAQEGRKEGRKGGVGGRERSSVSPQNIVTHAHQKRERVKGEKRERERESKERDTHTRITTRTQHTKKRSLFYFFI